MAIIFWYFLILTLLLQAYFIFTFFTPLLKPVRRPKRLPLPVSVIICAKDESNNLKINLPFILNQHHPEFEVIVMDDHSVDDTKKTVEELRVQYKNLKYIKASQDIREKPGKKWALSEAIKQASHNQLLLTDADCRPSSLTWIEEMSSHFVGKISIVLGIGQYNPSNKWYNALVQYETFTTAITYLGFANARKPYMGVGRNLAYKKGLFEDKLMMTNDLASGDDDLFVQRIANSSNTGICIDEKAHTFSNAPESYSEWLRQKTRHYSTGPQYSRPNIIRLALLKISLYVPNFLMILLLFMKFHTGIILSVFLLRWMICMGILNLLRKRLGFSQQIYLLPWFEIYFTFFDLWLAIKNAMMTPRAWK